MNINEFKELVALSDMKQANNRAICSNNVKCRRMAYFYCALSKGYCGRIEIDSPMRYLSGMYGVHGIVVFSVRTNETTYYNKNYYSLKLENDRLALIVNEGEVFYWTFDDLESKSGIDRHIIINKIRENKIKVNFNIRKKDHGTLITLYK